jgi:PAS domain S-box-containing protein
VTESTIKSSAEVVGIVEAVPIRVLHVDDESSFLKVAKQCLEMQGLFQVETASSVEEAMEKLEEKDFDAIVSDYVMPGKDGLEFLKELRHSGNNIPFIIFTGKGREEVAIKALNLGADRYFNKVGDPETVYGELAHGIRQSVERKRYEEKLSALNTYSQKLNMAGSMEEIYELALDAAEKTLGFEFADILMIEGKMLCLVTHRGPSANLSPKLPLDGDKGITVRAARTGKPVFVPDISKEKAYVEGGLEMRSELAVPIKIRDKVLGVLSVESERLNAFDEKDQKLLEILALHAATAMSNLEHAKNLEAYAREIRESQEKFKGLFVGNPEATVYVNQDMYILDVNPRFEELFGYSLDEVKGEYLDNVVVPRDKMEEGKMLHEKALKGHFYYDTVRKRKDGSLVPVSISAAPITVGGKLVGTVGVYKDISQLRKAEKSLRNTLKKLETVNEKLRVVGRLTRHDVRNKLAAVTGNVYLAKKRLPADHENMDQLVEIESAVRQVEKIFDFARTYERLGAEELVYMDVEKDVEGAVALFSDLQGVKVVNDCRGLTVLADSLLRQLLYNLVDNSLKYGEKISQIRVYYEEADEDELKLVYEDDGVAYPRLKRRKF